jgi:inner membrane protein
VPTIVSHALVAATAGALCGHGRRIVGWAVFCAVLPDVDVAWYYLGVPLDHPLGHRGFTHSLAFAAAVAAAVARFGVGLRWGAPSFARVWAFLFLIGASHGVLDAFTDAWLGIAFFWPFHDTRYLFPWRPLEVSEFIDTFFSARGVEVALSETLWIGIPCAAALAWHALRRRRG